MFVEHGGVMVRAEALKMLTCAQIQTSEARCRTSLESVDRDQKAVLDQNPGDGLCYARGAGVDGRCGWSSLKKWEKNADIAGVWEKIFQPGCTTSNGKGPGLRFTSFTSMVKTQLLMALILQD